MSDVSEKTIGNVISSEFKERAEGLLAAYDSAYANQKDNGASILIPIIANYGELALQMLRSLVKENMVDSNPATQEAAR